MIDCMQRAIIKKDIGSITANRNLFTTILILPIVLGIIIPFIFTLIVAILPLDSDALKQFIALLPKEILIGDIRKYIMEIVLMNMLPFLFLLIPIITSMVMSASSFVGEKEKRTLETLLYCPLTISKIFIAKIIGVFLFSQCISLISFVAMTIILQIEIWFITGSLMAMGINWVVMLLILSPSVSLLAISLIVRTSAKSKSVEEAQQRSSFIILPIIILVVSQLSGIVFIGIWWLFAISVICAVIGFFALRSSASKFNSEKLLQ